MAPSARPYRLAIVGSRSVRSFSTVAQAVRHFLDRYGRPGLVLSGGADGVDRLAAEFASFMSLPVHVFRPDWAAHGRRAGLVRNERLVAEADFVLAIWDGRSRGTAHTVACARRAGLPVVLIRV